MKGIFITMCLGLMLFLTGCGNLSPRQQQEIDNQNGKIDEIKNNQNGLMLDLLKNKQQLELQARDIGTLQQGFMNSSNQNSGVQILSGTGGLVLALAMFGVGILLIIHYRSKAVKNEKVAEMLADQIALFDNIELDNSVFLSAMNSNVETEVYHYMVQSQNRAGNAHKGMK